MVTKNLRCEKTSIVTSFISNKLIQEDLLMITLITHLDFSQNQPFNHV